MFVLQKESLVQGTKLLGGGCFQGLTGIIMDPVKLAEKQGVIGIFKGVATGCAGLITKPASGVLGCASKTASSIGVSIRSFGNKVTAVNL